jgi:hypothetical protein
LAEKFFNSEDGVMYNLKFLQDQIATDLRKTLKDTKKALKEE